MKHSLHLSFVDATLAAQRICGPDMHVSWATLVQQTYVATASLQKKHEVVTIAIYIFVMLVK